MILDFIKSTLVGIHGEMRAKDINVMLGLHDEFYIINNLTIKNDVTNTSQIDHVLIGKKTGDIYVIETKNYSGSVVGDIGNKYWEARYLNKEYDGIGTEKHYIRNPLFQNYGHIKAIQKVLADNGIKYKANQFHSIIHYVNENETKVSVFNHHNEEGKLFQPENVVTNPTNYVNRINFLEAEAKERLKSVNANIKDIYLLSKKVKDTLNEENLTKGLGFKSIINCIKHIKNVKNHVKKENKII